MAIDARYRNRVHDAAISAIRRGHLTMAEVAALIDIDRQLVRHWCQRAGVDPVAARARYVAGEWVETLRKKG